jgi:putative transposase
MLPCRPLKLADYRYYQLPDEVLGRLNMDESGIGSMATRQRHTAAQIATKLATANEMVAQGRLHSEIAKSLGVSLMTYHRWRKARDAVTRPAPRPATNADMPAARSDWEQASHIRDLQHENSRLRRLVADLLLEKVKLEEDLHGNTFRQTAGRN